MITIIKRLSETFFRSIGIAGMLVVCLAIIPVEAAITPQNIKGGVEVLFAGQKIWTPLVSTAQLEPGDQVRTGSPGKVELLCEDGSILRPGLNSQIAITELTLLKDEKMRVFHFELVQGTVMIDVVELDFTRYKLTDESLGSLQSDGLPENNVKKLTSLIDKEFTEHKEFLKAVKKKIGGKTTGKYKKLLLEHADLMKNIFAVKTDLMVVRAIGSSGMIAGNSCTFTDGTFQIDQTGQSPIYIQALPVSNDGIKFPFNQTGGWILIIVDLENAKVELASNAPIPQILSLFGEGQGMMRVENNKDAPDVSMIYEGETIQFKGGEKGVVGIPEQNVMPITLTPYANVVFQFISFFVFKETEGCPPSECCFVRFERPKGRPQRIEIPEYKIPKASEQQTGSPATP